MLSFDLKGNLKPYQLIPSRIDEIKKYLVDEIVSETRIINFDKYIRYSDDLNTFRSQ